MVEAQPEKTLTKEEEQPEVPEKEDPIEEGDAQGKKKKKRNKKKKKADGEGDDLGADTLDETASKPSQAAAANDEEEVKNDEEEGEAGEGEAAKKKKKKKSKKGKGTQYAPREQDNSEIRMLGSWGPGEWK